ncbi:hypothetical protein [Acetivibrio clariflavus]|uniref:Uncharacterized protein n=1 Tax=Acetivibrio clariflavus (strain DSM 19732 / NBRC 101661 / EBR45) TaxID=720554 RepID=G8LYL8_ACECE|nr:hypothetical protein [Acetivibrio clariflavus]AEV70006.1 hypothetical protein Clocl_3527 [Acetivibrio clariflavus DSM 19732]HOQ02024.1 hypothetical protein [Acetivibrio clariflavus]HPU42175.1 hypothetical protein [Acetivibrio clariflavus]
MKGILSIDFDYFIDASSQDRDLYFPDGSDEIPNNKLESMWEERYKRYPQLKKIGVIEQFNFLKRFLMGLNLPDKNFIKADSHKYIKSFIDKFPKNLKLKIINIDFHHDCYHYYKGSDYCNCGNWLRRVIEERPDTKVKWVRRKDSQIYCLEGVVPFEHTEDIKSIYNEKFDYVFICKSPEWSPPHLNNKFEELVSSVSKKLLLIS